MQMTRIVVSVISLGFITSYLFSFFFGTAVAQESQIKVSWPQGSCLPQPILNQTNVPNLTDSQEVRYLLRSGSLKPQLEQVLKDHLHIQQVVWQVDESHYWPTEFELIADTWEQLVEKLVRPYRIRVSLHANHVALIEYAPTASAAKVGAL